MAKDPAFLFYSQDFYTGVATLNWEERGKFISILCLMHQQGRMSEETIRFLVGSISDNLKSKFLIDDNGLWYNQRLEIESEKRAKFTESRRNNGLSGGRPPKNKPSAKPKNNLSVKHMDTHMEDENENRNKTEKTELEQTFEAYIEMRKKIKKPATEHAIELVKKKLESLSKGDEKLKIAILNQSIVNSWQDIYELKANQQQSKLPFLQPTKTYKTLE